MSALEKPAELRARHPLAFRGTTLLPLIKTAALLALLLAYALGFAILYPLAQRSMTERMSEGLDPTATPFVSP